MNHAAPLIEPPRQVVRAVRAALAVVIAVLAITNVASGVAEAAPPLTLKATPNPVVIPNGQTSGLYDLTWSTGSSAPAELSVSIDNGPPVLFNQVAAGTAAGIPIAYGQVHTWRMTTKASPRVVTTMNVSTKHPDQSCLSSCIKAIKINPHGTFADVKVIATAKLKTFELTASKAGAGVSSAMIGWDTATWTTQLLTLDPGTKYFYELKVTDDSGNSQVSTGAFTTLKRHVDFEFDSITVTDDSDDLSEGDLMFWFNTNDVWDLSTHFDDGIDTGSTVNPGYSSVLIGGPDTVKLGIYGYDDDCDPFDGLCSMGIGPGGSYGGSHGEGDWVHAYTSVNTLVSGPGESFSAPFSMANSGYALSFAGSGTYTVTYI